MIVRIVIWSLSESDATIEELRDTLPDLEPPGTWLWNEGSERFGAVLVDEDVAPVLERARELIGRDADVYEEFDAL